MNSTLEHFFKNKMPATTKLIEEMWSTDRVGLSEFLTEYMEVVGSRSFGYNYLLMMKEHTINAPHDYTNPWKVM